MSAAFEDCVATKDDLGLLEQRLTQKLEALELRMTIKLGGIVVIAMGVLAAYMKAILP